MKFIKGFQYKEVDKSNDEKRASVYFTFEHLSNYYKKGQIIIPDCQSDINNDKIEKFKKILDNDPDYFNYDTEPILLAAIKDDNQPIKVLQTINGQHRLLAIIQMVENGQHEDGQRIKVSLILFDTTDEMEKHYWKIHSDSTKTPFPKREFIEKQYRKIIKSLRKDVKKEYKDFLSISESKIYYSPNELVEKLIDINFFERYQVQTPEGAIEKFNLLNKAYYKKYYRHMILKSASDKEEHILEHRMVFLLKSNNSFDVSHNKVSFCDIRLKKKPQSKNKSNNKIEYSGKTFEV
jgi:hypothetical protein